LLANVGRALPPLDHIKIENTVRYLDVCLDDALALAKGTVNVDTDTNSSIQRVEEFCSPEQFTKRPSRALDQTSSVLKKRT
jgi:hypothetical protein